MLIYKIMPLANLEIFEKSGAFTGLGVDLTDGYIHFSTAKQVKETASKHFYGQENLSLVWTEASTLGEKLKWELSRGNNKFPHLYRDWSYGEILGKSNLPWKNFKHEFPEFLQCA
jgi:uncharacterized protein (DUF952 family)